MESAAFGQIAAPPLVLLSKSVPSKVHGDSRRYDDSTKNHRRVRTERGLVRIHAVSISNALSGLRPHSPCAVRHATWFRSGVMRAVLSQVWEPRISGEVVNLGLSRQQGIREDWARVDQS